MIFGVGCDLCDIGRVERNCDRLVERIMSYDERVMIGKKKNKHLSVAANFAAKEAFSKALGTGVRGFALRDVEILRTDNGQPYINLCGKAKEICENLEISGMYVSLSHTEKLAMAYVVLER